jgi:hypothetical protein
MKHFCLLSIFFVLAINTHATLVSGIDTLTMQYECFDFSRPDSQKFTFGDKADLILQISNGGGWGFSAGFDTGCGITDMGAANLDDILVAPDTGYAPVVVNPIVSHVFCVKTKDNHYAKFKFQSTNKGLSINWVYQNGSNRTLK